MCGIFDAFLPVHHSPGGSGSRHGGRGAAASAIAPGAAGALRVLPAEIELKWQLITAQENIITTDRFFH